VVGSSRILIVTGASMSSSVRRQAPEIPPGQILREEIGRDTAASIAIAAQWLVSRHGDAVMVILPADHAVRPVAAFRSALRRAIRVARSTRRLLTIGVTATRPEPGLGYIRPGNRRLAPGIWDVRAFVEKPSAERAAKMIRSGRYLWNTGIFVWRASAILAGLRRHRPDILSALRPWTRSAARGARTVPARVLRRVPRSPIDRAVLERSRDLLVMRAPFEWTDVGTWDTFSALLQPDRAGNAALGRILALDASRCLAVNEGGLTVFVGVNDVAAIHSGGALLICKRSSVQRARDVVRLLRGPLAAYR
jgi:mannose-1-phosphate guanylyltransferase